MEWWYWLFLRSAVTETNKSPVTRIPSAPARSELRSRLFQLPRNPADHPEGFGAPVAVPVFPVRVHQGKVTGFDGLLLTFLIHHCAFAPDNVVHVHHNF
jgi:hypothetical protein